MPRSLSSPLGAGSWPGACGDHEERAEHRDCQRQSPPEEQLAKRQTPAPQISEREGKRNSNVEAKQAAQNLGGHVRIVRDLT